MQTEQTQFTFLFSASKQNCLSKCGMEKELAATPNVLVHSSTATNQFTTPTTKMSLRLNAAFLVFIQSPSALKQIYICMVFILIKALKPLQSFLPSMQILLREIVLPEVQKQLRESATMLISTFLIWILEMREPQVLQSVENQTARTTL